MKRILHKSNLLWTIVALFCVTFTFGQDAGFNTTFIVLKINNGANVYYDLKANTANPDLSGANLGTFCQGSATGLVFKGAEHNVYKCNGCDISSTRIYYRIYPTASPSGNFVNNNIGYFSGFNNGCGGADQSWANTGYSTNLLSGLSAGNYTLEVYSDATTSCLGTIYAGNGGANYKATFTVNANITYYADADGDGFGNLSAPQTTCTGVPFGHVTNSSDCNDGLTLYQDSDNDGFGSTIKVACGGVTNSGDCDDNELHYQDNDNDGFGSAIFVGCGGSLNSLDCNDAVLTYADADGDGFGSSTFTACNGVTNNNDCDDTNNLITVATFYRDADNDGYGNAALTIQACTAPTGYVTNSTDCNDGVAAINPGHGEILYNGFDDNCNGSLDEGFQYTTQIQSQQCATTLSTINSFIVAYSIPYVTRHRFEVTNTSTNQVQVIERSQNYFSPTMLASYDYATTYSVRVEVQRNGVWLGYYGPSCLVSTPAVLVAGGAATISPSQCGNTIATISTLIATTSLPNVTGYKFRVTNVDPLAVNPVQIIDRGSYHWFALTMLPTFNYGTTYLVEVAIKTNGAFSVFGSPCAVSSPAVPTLTNCGAVIATKGALISAPSLNRVTSYRFEVTNLSNNQVTTLDRTQNWFTFNNIPGFTPGAEYSVRIAMMTSGVYSPFGEACSITAPAAARTNSHELSFDAVVYPNPFSDAFNIRVNTSSEENFTVTVYDMTGRLIESTNANLLEMQTLQIGDGYQSGIYNVVLTQGEQFKTMRVIKR